MFCESKYNKTHGKIKTRAREEVGKDFAAEDGVNVCTSESRRETIGGLRRQKKQLRFHSRDGEKRFGMKGATSISGASSRDNNREVSS